MIGRSKTFSVSAPDACAVGRWARDNRIWRVAIADLSKNIYATYNACRGNGLQVRCIAESNPAFIGLNYRGLPILSDGDALDGQGIEGVVLSSTNAAQIEPRLQSLRRRYRGPILRLWSPAPAAAVLDTQPDIQAEAA